jgi:aryl-alcohol dehydrogenase-like predicted oxidoreductase
MGTPSIGGRFVLGLASLHHLNLPSQRQRFLQRALDLGVRHFDVAPMYGNGLDERELGIALRGQRSAVTIATKFGIPFRPYGEWSRLLFLPLRMGDRLLPGYHARQAARDYSPGALQASVEASLRRLQTDHVDVLLLHEPPARAEGIDMMALADRAAKLRADGKIGTFGVAGERAASDPWPTAPGIDIIQAPLDAIAPRVPTAFNGRHRAFFVYRHYIAACPNRERSFDEHVNDVWNARPDIDMLFATRSFERLEQFARLITR